MSLTPIPRVSTIPLNFCSMTLLIAVAVLFRATAVSAAATALANEVARVPYWWVAPSGTVKSTGRA
jgi:hypothetical protein